MPTSGETATVSDYVSQKTMENLETYAPAIETRFEELGGQLTARGSTGRQPTPLLPPTAARCWATSPAW